MEAPSIGTEPPKMLPTETADSEINISESDRKEIADSLMAEFEFNSSELDRLLSLKTDDDFIKSREHFALAVGSAVGIVSVYANYFDDSEIEHLYEELSDRSSYSDVFYFGYTHSGVRVMAFSHRFGSHSFYYYPFAQELLGDDKEGDLLEFASFSGLDVYDIYVEDLTGSRTTFDMQVKFFAHASDEYTSDPPHEFAPLTNPTGKAKDFLEKYNRELADSGNFEFGTWNLFAPDYDVWEFGNDFLRLVIDDEEIELFNYIP
jgi:hypothetical protein